MSPINYIRRSAAGILVGVVALTMVTAVLSGSLAAIRANDTVHSLAADLHAARVANEQLHATVDQLAEQNRRILAQNDALVRFLRRHGLKVPQVIYTPRTSPSTVEPSESGSTPPSPKPAAPSPGQTSSTNPSPASPPSLSPTATATPSPTTPAPTVDPLEPVCHTAPILCISAVGSQ